MFSTLCSDANNKASPLLLQSAPTILAGPWLSPRCSINIKLQDSLKEKSPPHRFPHPIRSSGAQHKVASQLWITSSNVSLSNSILLEAYLVIHNNILEKISSMGIIHPLKSMSFLSFQTDQIMEERTIRKKNKPTSKERNLPVTTKPQPCLLMSWQSTMMDEVWKESTTTTLQKGLSGFSGYFRYFVRSFELPQGSVLLLPFLIVVIP